MLYLILVGIWVLATAAYIAIARVIDIQRQIMLPYADDCEDDKMMHTTIFADGGGADGTGMTEVDPVACRECGLFKCVCEEVINEMPKTN